MMSMRVSVVLLALLALSSALLAADPPAGVPAPVEKKAIYQLSDFGPVTTPAQMKAAYEAALAALGKMGGLLVIPVDAAKVLKIENTTQISPRTPAPPEETKNWQKQGPGVTIIEVNETQTIIKVPQVGGLTIQRTLRMPSTESLPHWSTDQALTINNKLIHGSNSYLDWLPEPVKAGKDAKFYVTTIRGLRPGMFLNLHQGPGYAGKVTRGCVKTLGYNAEKKMWYFTADTSTDHVRGAIVHNKNNEGVLYLAQDTHCDEQTYDVMLKRHQYALGDTYMYFGWYEYMSNIHSAAGDENGNIFAGYSKSMDNIFTGAVESVDWQANTLKFTGAQNVDTLGQSRPLINLNPAKWITKGKVMIVPAESYWDTVDTGKFPFQGKTYPTTVFKNERIGGVPNLRMGGLIRGDKDCPWDQSVVGKWFGITEPSELTPGGRKVRWYEILSCTQNADGTKDLTIQRFWWGAKEMHSPTLYRLENGTWDGHIRPLSYAIAPGSYVTDVSKAVPTSDYPGERILGMTPYPDMNTALDFAKGDKIEQAVGPDPFKPTPFRMWCWDNVPGVFPAPILDLANWGADPRYSAMSIRGSQDNSDDINSTYRQLPPWENGIILEAGAGVGINFAADCTNAAILFKQPYHEQPIKWYYGKETPGKPRAEAALTVSRDTGALTFTGGDLIINGTVHAKGFSTDVKAEKKVFGKNVPVPAGAKSLTITFDGPQADADYAVFLELSWIGDRAVTAKTEKGFTITFAKPAPKNAKVDWMLMR
ncbi:MAG: hypothetical protein ACYC7E_21935 [Armatimonadota bacterium]